jgi:hypothetical protein
MRRVARPTGSQPRSPRRAAPLLAALLLAAAAPGDRAPEDTMPRHAPGLEDGAPRLARLRAMDQPGVAVDRVRLGLLLPTGARGAAFAAAFGQALAAAAPAGVFGRRIELLPAFAEDEAAAAAAGASLAGEVLVLVSGLAEAPQAAALAAADAIPLLGLRPAVEASPWAFALLPGVVEEAVALLQAAPGPAVILAGDAAERQLAARIAGRLAASGGAAPQVIGPAALPGIEAAAVLLLAAPTELAAAAAPLRDAAMPVLVPGSRGGLAAMAAAEALGRPVLVGLGVSPATGEGAARDRFLAGEAAQTGLTGRLGHAAGEVVVEALRRAGPGLTREALLAGLAGPAFETGALPPLRLAGGAAIRLIQVDAAGRILPGPAAE